MGVSTNLMPITPKARTTVFGGESALMQPFDDDGNLLCLSCGDPIASGDLYIEIRQRVECDSDPRLAAHLRCAAPSVWRA